MDWKNTNSNGFGGLHKKATPSKMKALGKNEHNDPPMERWSYASLLIARYLQGTKEKGLVMEPTKELEMDLYADEDFAGLWNAEDANDTICTNSRTEILLTIGNVPLLWKSKLQTETALSTMES